MQQFKIPEAGIQQMRKQVLTRLFPVLLLIVIGGVFISTINSKDDETGIGALAVVIPVMVMVLIVSFALFSVLKKQQQVFRSYIFTIGDNYIEREQLFVPTITLYHNEIREIIKNKNNSYTIRGKNNSDIIIIPAQVERYDELESALQQIKPETVAVQQRPAQRFGLLLPIASIGLMVTVYTVMNKVVVAIAGILLTGLMVWSFIAIRRSKLVEQRTKNFSWWLLLVMASVIGVVLLKLFYTPEK